MRIAIVPLLLGLIQTGQAQPAAPSVTPLFMAREAEGGPAFLVECSNTGSLAISSVAESWALSRSAIRIDGTVLDDQPRIGPGIASDIPSGGTWRGIIELRQAPPRTSFAAALGANVRVPTVVALSAGRHTISVRCFGVWAPDLPFYWER